MDGLIAEQRDFNVIPNAINDFSKETVLSVFKSMSRLRKFEQVLIDSYNKDKSNFKIKIHMVSGQEASGSALAEVFAGSHFFIGHRNADLYLALGAPAQALRDEILCLDTGCMKGKQGTNFACHTDKISLYGGTAFIGEQIPIAAGFALANGEKTIAICGDGAAEEDYALQAYGFAATHKLPILFVINDNNYSVLSVVERRRSWGMAELAKGFGLNSVDIADDPWTLMKVCRDIGDRLPALINVRVNRNHWHVGVGIDGPPLWDRYTIVKQQITELGYETELREIEHNAEQEMRELWREYL